MKDYGVTIDRVVCCGGIAEKNDLFMQIYADVIGQPMLIAGSAQTPALGAAISAAVTAGQYGRWDEAQERMTRLKPTAYEPRPAAAMRLRSSCTASTKSCTTRSAAWQGARPDLGSVMKRLLVIKERASGAAGSA